MRIQGFGRTDVGRKRTNNEDALFIDEELGVYLVCDGMGGHKGGEVASDTATKLFAKVMRENVKVLAQGTDDELDHLLEEAVQTACARVYDLGQRLPELSGMGTTFTGLVIRGSRGFVVHVGDSRLYLLRDGKVHRLTDDHTYFHELMKTGRLTAEQASKFVAAQSLTRAVGLQRSVVVDHLQFDVLQNDTFMICSDGLVNHLQSDDEILAQCQNTDVSELAEVLVDLALDRGGSDNTTVVVVNVTPEPERTDEAQMETEVTFRTNLLRDVAIFQHLSMPERVGLLSYMTVEDYPAGTTVIAEGSVGESVDIVLDGELAVVVGGTEVARLTRGDHFGEMSVLTQRPRSATVVATRNVRSLRMSGEAFHMILQKQPAVGVRMLWNLAQVLAIRLDERPESAPPRPTDTALIHKVQGRS